MRNFLKKFNTAPHQSEDAEGSNSARSVKSSGASSPDKLSPSCSHEHKHFSGLSDWLSSVANRKSPSPSASNVTRGDRVEPSDSVSGSGFVAASEAVDRDSESTASRDPDTEEEYQIQQALALSAREDPEAVQIEAIKQISLGSCAPANTPSEVVAYRYWNYDSLGYDDKIMDGFYDMFGTLTESTPESMPSLLDLQGLPVSDNVTWEAVLVNKAADSNLLKLQEKALEMAVKSRSESQAFVTNDLVLKLATLVSDYMGGSVVDPYNMSKAWQSLRYSLRVTLGSMVLPLGSLTIGLPRHRALMFKFLADSIGIPCRLVKGHQYTGSAELALNFVKFDDGRENIVDLMADPGTLIPSDAAGSRIEFDHVFLSSSSSTRDVDSSLKASSSNGIASSFGEHSDIGTLNKISRLKNISDAVDQSDSRGNLFEDENQQSSTKGKEVSRISSEDLSMLLNVEKAPVKELPGKPKYPNAHARSRSWTEGISSPAVHKKKVKDVSLYMIDAAYENPRLAQKLHNVLLESGVVAPPNLFSQASLGRLNATDSKSLAENKDEQKSRKETHYMKYQDDVAHSRFLVPLPLPSMQSGASPCTEPEQLKPANSSGIKEFFGTKEVGGLPVSFQPEVTPWKYTKNFPVATAPTAGTGAEVFASSMVVGVAKSSSDSYFELSAATTTAAAMVATPAAATEQCGQGAGNDGDADSAGFDPLGSGDRGGHGRGSGERVTGSQGSGIGVHDNSVGTSDCVRMCNRSAGSDTSSSDVTLDDVADCEIHWEEIRLGERIGLGSYGEVYRAEWHGTEVAVKRLLDQGISGESLTEFISEVQIMKKIRHPNVVLFMGAVTRAPNLSIVTEFLPRGSMYRLIHRPNNQLDERRRLRMALDAARGMNYLHNCTPVIVHRDLKSPNLLVDKNWVVKVSDFGLSRMKHSTFLSSRSTAGTAEWMAPEILRNEPANEKCDVFSFGVILWELFTLRQPWGGMNSMQVVGAVGFQHRRLAIPDDMDPSIADIIRNCLQTDPKLRPTFAEIMAALKPLQKPVTAPLAPRPSVYVRSQHKKEQSTEAAEDQTV